MIIEYRIMNKEFLMTKGKQKKSGLGTKGYRGGGYFECLGATTWGRPYIFSVPSGK